MTMIGGRSGQELLVSESFDADRRYREILRSHLVDDAPRGLVEAERRIDRVAPTLADRLVFGGGVALTVVWTGGLLWLVAR